MRVLSWEGKGDVGFSSGGGETQLLMRVSDYLLDGEGQGKGRPFSAAEQEAMLPRQ